MKYYLIIYEIFIIIKYIFLQILLKSQKMTLEETHSIFSNWLNYFRNSVQFRIS
jgi:hypothetical protein